MQKSIILFFVCAVTFNEVYSQNVVSIDISRQCLQLVRLFQLLIYYNNMPYWSEILNYMSQYGEKMAYILTLISKPDVWWLWQHSIFANTITNVLKLENICDYTEFVEGTFESKLNSIEKAFAIVHQTLVDFIQKNDGTVTLFPTYEYNKPNEIIFRINYGMRKLDDLILNNLLSNQYDGALIKIKHYTPTNLFLGHIGQKQAELIKLLLENVGINWFDTIKMVEILHKVAVNKWVSESYTELKDYYDSVTLILKSSIYGHIRIHSSAFQKYVNRDISVMFNKGNMKEFVIKDMWKSMIDTLSKFISKFKLEKDENMQNLFLILSNSNFNINDIDIIEKILNSEFEKISTLSHGNIKEDSKKLKGILGHIFTLKSLISITTTNNIKFINYFTSVSATLNDINFETINIFFQSISVL
ncbi:uncharacterized protein LOC126897460 [Daktulosphaira vitifoliae]|uniref:uncharacterized protein LOC126897460 n=1 Tax=Daktulosphaira vitifoliae TaxID=58002 RepID=UPI0021A97984|nr:uncharacterized protein LOC126897460 [Daktulosphaira vitifoliae]